MSSYINLFKKLIGFVDRKIKFLIFYSALVGTILFISEYFFIFGLQGFLISIGIMNSETASLPSWFPQSSSSSLIIFAFFGLTRTFTSIASSYLATSTNQTFLGQQRRKYVEYGINYSSDTSTHEVVSIFTDTVSRVGIIFGQIVGIITTLINIALLLVLGSSLAPNEMAIGIGLLFLILIPTRLLNSVVLDSGEGLTSDWSIVNKTLFEGMRHHFFFKAHGVINEQIAKASTYLKSYEKHYKTYAIYAAAKNSTPNMGGIIIITFIAYLSIHYLKTPPANLLAFLYVYIRISQSGGQLFSLTNEMKLHMSSVDSLYNWNKKIDKKLKSESKKCIVRNTQTQLELELKADLEFRNVQFSYEDSQPLIQNLNFIINKGEVLIIQGVSGSGKSTIVSLILGINIPEEGEVLLNSKNLYLQMNELKDVISYVGPEPFLFEGSIRDNLLFGHPKKSTISDDDLKEGLKEAEALEIVNSLKNGLDEVLREHAAISTGQKQRLSLARAFIRKPRFLIMDEATANLDSATEKKVMDNIKPRLKEITTLIITHKENLRAYGDKHISLS